MNPQSNPTSDLGPTIRLPERGLILVHGAESHDFLQGQLSCDLRKLDAAHALLGSYNSAKGRVLAILRVILPPQDLGWPLPAHSVLLELDRAVLDATLKRLRMFVLRAKVTLEDASDRFELRGLIGTPPGIATDLPVLGCQIWQPGVLAIREAGAEPRHTLLAPTANALAVINDSEAASSRWQQLRIRSGLPALSARTQDIYVAQMLNLDRLGALAFDKGCYAGQEIIARLHYRGGLKRRLNLCTCAGDPPPPGTVVRDAQDAEAGDVVEAIALPGALPGESALALAVLRMDSLDRELLLPDGRRLQPQTP